MQHAVFYAQLLWQDLAEHNSFTIPHPVNVQLLRQIISFSLSGGGSTLVRDHIRLWPLSKVA